MLIRLAFGYTVAWLSSLSYRIMRTRTTLLFTSLMAMSACDKELPPPSVDELVRNPILLEGVMVRCAQDRSATRYEQECINAREAVDRVEAKENARRREELEVQSERKRAALRRAQQAAAEARRRAAEAERLRKEREYLAQFGQLPPPEVEEGEGDRDTGNVPGIRVIPPVETDGATVGTEDSGTGYANTEFTSTESVSTENTGSEIIEPDPEPELPSDLSEIRDELRRRSEQQ